MEYQKVQIQGSRLRKLASSKKKYREFRVKNVEDNQKKALATAFKHFPDITGIETTNLKETALRTGNLEELYSTRLGFIQLNPIILAATMSYLTRKNSLQELKLDINTDFTVSKLKDLINIIVRVNKAEADDNTEAQVAATILRYTKWIFRIK